MNIFKSQNDNGAFNSSQVLEWSVLNGLCRSVFPCGLTQQLASRWWASLFVWSRTFDQFPLEPRLFAPLLIACEKLVDHWCLQVCVARFLRGCERARVASRHAERGVDRYRKTSLTAMTGPALQSLQRPTLAPVSCLVSEVFICSLTETKFEKNHLNFKPSKKYLHARI